MIKLPATTIEAEALAAARRTLGHFLDGPLLPRWRFGVFDREVGTALVRDCFRTLAETSTHGLRQVIAYARAGVDDADAVLRELATDIVNRPGEQVPTFLQVYLIDAHVMPVGPKPRGPKRKNQFLRDIGIAVMVVELVERFGLKATRLYGATKRQSACAIVATVLGEAKQAGAIDFNVTEQAVVAIWKRMGPQLGRPSPQLWVA